MENSILDFIQNTFKDAQTINLEKVGQYLKNENLRVYTSDENNWQSFIRSKLLPKGEFLRTFFFLFTFAFFYSRSLIT